MRIVNLTDEHLDLYMVCLEDWSDEIKEAGDHKACWYARMEEAGKGLRVKLAQTDDGQIVGMIQYIPIEHSFAQGHDTYFILCIWVHGHKQGIGNHQKQGLGQALLQAAEADARELGARSMAAWGIVLPFWMKASWFRRQGYRRVDREGVRALMWKPFVEGAEPPHWFKRRKHPPNSPNPSKVTVTAFLNGWCPAVNLGYERARRAAAEFGDKVEFRSIDTFEREVFMEWGILDGLFIDGQEVNLGPPPSYQKLRKRLARKIARVKIYKLTVSFSPLQF